MRRRLAANTCPCVPVADGPVSRMMRRAAQRSTSRVLHPCSAAYRVPAHRRGPAELALQSDGGLR